jgi:carbon storage regulator
MLVLERKLQEGFWINDNIFVKVLSIGRRRVRIGVEAPTEAKVVRDELRASANRNGTEKNATRSARTE